MYIHIRSNILVECLVPDFRGDEDCVATIVNSNLDVFAHNIETVERLTPFVRDRRARYRYNIFTNIAYIVRLLRVFIKFH